LLSTRLNVNWDEFYFLSHVYSLLRGELDFILLGAYTHLFTWLTDVSGDEMRQIVVARWTMLCLLGITCWLIFQLGRRWLTGLPSVIPCFVYLSAMPVILHGGSFRYDSMLAPLSMAALALLASPLRRTWQDHAAGLLLGIAFAVSVKVVLFAPLYLSAIVFRDSGSTGPTVRGFPEISMTAIRVIFTGAIVAVVLLALHSLSVTSSASDALVADAGSAARKTLFQTPWFPRVAFLEAYLRWQPLSWSLIAIGTVIALARRNFAVATLALALLPIAFYRNAFPYYYVVMLAPAVILAGYALQEIMAVVRSRASSWVASSLLVAVWLGLLYQGVGKVNRLLVDDQVIQQSLISGIHGMFPEPVNYIDRCGMISSFRKVNFFMSTWGMENYRAAGVPFMPGAIRDSRPAFVLVNTGALSPANRGPGGLLPEDAELVERYYPTYWGPVRVAGGRAVLDGSAAGKLHVPFADEYRVFASQPVLIDGVLRENGSVVRVTDAGVVAQAAKPATEDEETTVLLFLASARPPPAMRLPNVPLFGGL
jgi:hypothetical protein